MELRQCVGLVELSLEHNKLVRPLLDFRSLLSWYYCFTFFFFSTRLISYSTECRAMAGLRILRLFGNPLEFLPEILPLHQLRHLSLVNIRIVSDENLRSVNVQIEVKRKIITQSVSYFSFSRSLSFMLRVTFHDARLKTLPILEHLGTS